MNSAAQPPRLPSFRARRDYSAGRGPRSRQPTQRRSGRASPRFFNDQRICSNDPAAGENSWIMSTVSRICGAMHHCGRFGDATGGSMKTNCGCSAPFALYHARLSVEPSTLAATGCTPAPRLVAASGSGAGDLERVVASHPPWRRGCNCCSTPDAARFGPQIESARILPRLRNRITKRIAGIGKWAKRHETFESGLARIPTCCTGERRKAAIKNLRQLTRTWKLRDPRNSVSYHLSDPLGTRNRPCRRNCVVAIATDLNRFVTSKVICASRPDFGRGCGRRHAFSKLRRAGESLDPPPLLTGDELIASGNLSRPQFRTWVVRNSSQATRR